MISEDSLLKTFVNEETRVGTSGANLLDRIFLGQLYFGFRKRRMLATSLFKSKSRAENSESDEALIVVESASLPSPSVPPIERSSSLICLLVRVSVPSFATDAAICAMPG